MQEEAEKEVDAHKEFTKRHRRERERMDEMLSLRETEIEKLRIKNEKLITEAEAKQAMW